VAGGRDGARERDEEVLGYFGHGGNRGN
jgi:hypothetical protein